MVYSRQKISGGCPFWVKERIYEEESIKFGPECLDASQYGFE